jgi:hypothetical protein
MANLLGVGGIIEAADGLKNPFRYDWLVLEAGGGEGLAE